MTFFFNLLAGAVSLYSFALMFRIILTWFNRMHHGRVLDVLSRITDPYLNWWRSRLNLRLGVLDLSPIVGLTALTVLQSIFATLGRHGRISVGIVLSIVLQAIWSIVSFLLIIALAIIVLRFVAYITGRNVYHSRFWRFIDTVSQPLLYKINRLIFGKRLVNYRTGIFASAAALGTVLVAGGFAVRLLSGLLLRMPL
ncbi:MAG: YggT family protein [Spirochaetes bacterium]|nr:YggT family protein [Spirochaetota bacterium]